MISVILVKNRIAKLIRYAFVEKKKAGEGGGREGLFRPNASSHPVVICQGGRRRRGDHY
jgi:hypothetical protein